ncbi:acyl-CoA-binding protein [Kriegella aquimaris]|uniref:acyl-CoA-binding protein n=1 Tax=Kriegella aquimaris TaxID=192904 RepID=UPI000B7F0D0C
MYLFQNGERHTQKKLLKLYGLYKQAMWGYTLAAANQLGWDFDSPKFQAWNAESGKTLEHAKNQ